MSVHGHTGPSCIMTTKICEEDTGNMSDAKNGGPGYPKLEYHAGVNTNVLIFNTHFYIFTT